MPFRFPLREQYGRGIRMGLVGRYVVLYRVSDREVTIAAIFHERQSRRGAKA